jgi:SAM-dependent methyltransferase
MVIADGRILVPNLSQARAWHMLSVAFGESALSANAVDIVADEFCSSLGANGVAFLRRLYSAGLQNYQRRLIALGLDTGGYLLDAGCGFGQWCFAAAAGYDRVVGVDILEVRVEACKRLAHLSGIRNCSFQPAALEKLPFRDESFDSAISYSVLYFTDFAHSLAELGRVLKAGGVLYCSTNDIGRFLIDVVENQNGAADFSPRLYGLASLGRTVLQRATGRRWLAGAAAMSRRRTELALKAAGFKILEIGPEGSLGRGDRPMQRGWYAGFPAVFDVLARKA